jgi:shikimate kinase
VPPSDAPAGHLVLVGLMGSGKSTVGHLLAERLHRPFFDSDEMVEARTGRTVREIFETDGEAAYRPLETDALLAALDSPEPAVIAAAGGVVLSPVNRAALKERAAEVVWLRASPLLLVDRALSQDHRPLLEHDPSGTLSHMAAERTPLYTEVADRIVDIDGLTPTEVADRIVSPPAPSAPTAPGSPPAPGPS